MHAWPARPPDCWLHTTAGETVPAFQQQNQTAEPKAEKFKCPTSHFSPFSVVCVLSQFAA